MANVGRAGETPKQQPAQQLEVNNEQQKTQEAQQNQKPVAPNCVWTVGEHELPYNAGTVGIFTKVDEQGKLLEQYNDSDMDGSLDTRLTLEYGKYGETTAMNLDFGNDGHVDHRNEYNENGKLKRTITFGLDGSVRVAEHIYDINGRRTHSMVDENNDGRFDRVEYHEAPSLTKNQTCPADAGAGPSAPEPDEPNQPKDLPEDGA